MRLRPMWPMYGTYIATLLGLALINRVSLSTVSAIHRERENDKLVWASVI
jgi:hypothetical protein